MVFFHPHEGRVRIGFGIAVPFPAYAFRFFIFLFPRQIVLLYRFQFLFQFFFIFHGFKAFNPFPQKPGKFFYVRAGKVFFPSQLFKITVPVFAVFIVPRFFSHPYIRAQFFIHLFFVLFRGFLPHKRVPPWGALYLCPIYKIVLQFDIAFGRKHFHRCYKYLFHHPFEQFPPEIIQCSEIRLLSSCQPHKHHVFTCRFRQHSAWACFRHIPVYKQLRHHHRVIPARTAACLILPQQPLYPHFINYFAYQPYQMAGGYQFVGAWRYQIDLILLVGFIRDLVAFSFAHVLILSCVLIFVNPFS